ncbi:phospholipase D/nuclease [Aspergillus heteromorphus CBS 117.55]|uniref:phospholipase D n=1 Tax=Aspergillus heteromorphus CBS 117.55 TaxID=1448321 RepID=A0A317WT13_9EURO|nr:phospholipase D/nuclease [Aspergillus heteromorphus CBS 117.55]PWY88921.1 phospholipase D/nuclease [Aspergillus heteromorphus CBS 117.55]
MTRQEEDLAYGQYHQNSATPSSTDTARGFVSDTFGKLKQTYKAQSSSQQASSQQSQPARPSPLFTRPPPVSTPGTNRPVTQNQTYQSQGSPHQAQKPQKQDKFSGLFGKLEELGNEVAQKLGTALDPQAYAQYGPVKPQSENRFGSFAPPRQGNEVKWHVDGCAYFYAVSKALETAKDYIWILDWWLTPELYLRRPPAKHEQYRLDRMLQAAAQRGVRVNIIVYKEVTQALTLSSHHTKHYLEELHPNISVFRHPDHLPDRQAVEASIATSIENLSLDGGNLAKMSEDAIKGLYGMREDVILYWAHHEKLCIIDGRVAFMGGLDMCFGRWDTNQHALADVHGQDLNEIVFPGQDYNNARVSDFHDVAHWEQNQLDRKKTSRMGWSDISVSLHGQVVEDLRQHFVQRWNFIYDLKYQSRENSRYSRLALYGRPTSSSNQKPQQGSQQAPQQGSQAQAPAIAPQPGANPGPPTPSWQHAASPQTTGNTQSAPAPSWQQQAAPQSSNTQPNTASAPSWQPQQQQQQQPPAGPATPTWQQQAPTQPGGSTQSPQTSSPSWQQHVASSQPAGYAAHSPQGASQEAPSLSKPAPYSPQAGQEYTYTGNSFPPPPAGPPPQGSAQAYPAQTPAQTGQGQAPYYPPPPNQATKPLQHSQTRGVESSHSGFDAERGLGRLRENFTDYSNVIRGGLAGQIHQYQDRFSAGLSGRPTSQPRGNMHCQIVRSCSQWSNGTPTEHSVMDAYIAVIRNSQHFIYIENQFFITATSDAQKPVQNKIGAAIVERILRAARAGEKFKIVVVMPSVPCFAGDLEDESTLGTRAIMEFQYNCINRGGHSIMELIAKEGFNPMDYIRFYNLRNYDRINVSGPLAAAEQRSGVDYEDARKQQDVATGGAGGYGPNAPRAAFDTTAPFQQYQQAAQQVGGGKSAPGKWDSVSSCYMLNGEDIRNVPWEGAPEAEIDAFVTEELYIHSKVMVADDRIAVIGSANLNDRSQLGTHDSEIAIIVEDYTPVHSRMNGHPWTASRFASSLRRQLFRKHLGLLAPQDPERPDGNFEPVGVPNAFDFEAPESQLVADPLADTVQSLWNTRAHTNTEVFRKVFHSVPDDTVRDWATYKEFYGYYFHNADKQAYGQDESKPAARYEYGHVVRDDFPPGPEGVRQVKELLSQVKGTLVEMPLMFLIDEDVAKEGLKLNEITEPIYT